MGSSLTNGRAPVIGITTNLDEREARVRRAYIDTVLRAGGIPVLLAPGAVAQATLLQSTLRAWIDFCDGFVFTGGDDPATEPFGEPTHPKAVRLYPARQQCETLLLRQLAEERPQTPVLGICLGMQLMGLVEGATLNQHLADDTPTHADHWNDHRHPIIPVPVQLPESLQLAGSVTSHHRQALSDPGPFRVLAHAPDGVIEAIDHPDRRFWLGVQWHPERSEDGPLGLGLFQQLIEACRRQSAEALPR